MKKAPLRNADEATILKHWLLSNHAVEELFNIRSAGKIIRIVENFLSINANGEVYEQKQVHRNYWSNWLNKFLWTSAFNGTVEFGYTRSSVRGPMKTQKQRFHRFCLVLAKQLLPSCRVLKSVYHKMVSLR